MEPETRSTTASVPADPSAARPATNGVADLAPLEPAAMPVDAPEVASDTAAPADAATTPAPEPAALSYWMRPLVLGIIVLILLAATIWDERRVPNRPARPDVLTATVVPGATVSAQDPALTDTLLRLRTALARRDARTLTNLAAKDGLIVASFGGGLPDSGSQVTDVQRFTTDLLANSQLAILGWRDDGRGRIIVLTDGWPRKPLRVSAGSTLEMTSLAAIGLAPQAGTWYVRWVLPDTAGVLAQQARSLVWQPLGGTGS